ncbi:hypothetical protein ACEQ8H_001121 [Pleosporales sp. CAS-2024a]
MDSCNECHCLQQSLDEVNSLSESYSNPELQMEPTKKLIQQDHNILYVIYHMRLTLWSTALDKVQQIDKYTGIARHVSTVQELCAIVSTLNQSYGFSTSSGILSCEQDEIQLSSDHDARNQSVFHVLSLASDETKHQRARIEWAWKDLNI